TAPSFSLTSPKQPGAGLATPLTGTVRSGWVLTQAGTTGTGSGGHAVVGRTARARRPPGGAGVPPAGGVDTDGAPVGTVRQKRLSGVAEPVIVFRAPIRSKPPTSFTPTFPSILVNAPSSILIVVFAKSV